MNPVRTLSNVPWVFVGLLMVSGCVTKYPTIAHVHIGHAITGAHDTPAGEGYFVVAEQRAQAARDLAARGLASSGSTESLKSTLLELNGIVNTSEFALKRAVEEAMNHIVFAADSVDASQNVRTSAADFKRNTEGVLYRCSLVNVYVQDALNTGTHAEVEPLASEVSRLIQGIIEGADVDGNGSIGGSPREFGMLQLRGQLEAMIDREDPPYTTVERWYLLNLVRMPSGEWMFRRSGSRSGSGY